MRSMQRANVNGTELEYEVLGQGEPVVFIHGSFLADGMMPLLEEPRLADKHQIVNYHRRGYGDSARPDGAVSIEQQAQDCLELMTHLGFRKAHVAGHSYGGTIALQVAMLAPERVHSLALLEPLLPRAEERAQQYLLNTATAALKVYETGDKPAALQSFLEAFTGPDIRSVIDLNLPLDAWDRAIADADTFFQVELASLQIWGFTLEDARDIKLEMPVLSVLGYSSDAACPGFRKGHEFLMSWLPNVERHGVPRATHAMQVITRTPLPRDWRAFSQGMLLTARMAETRDGLHSGQRSGLQGLCGKPENVWPVLQAFQRQDRPWPSGQA